MSNLFEVVLIETQSTCNRRCWFCKFGQPQSRAETKRLSDALIAKIADNLAYLNFAGRISPFGINEPLLDSRIVSIVRKFRQACPRAYISLISNGDALNQDLLWALLDAGMDAIAISIYDPKARDRLRDAIAPELLGAIAFIDMEVPRYLENRAGSIPGFSPVEAPCQRPSNMLVIKASGDIVICCADMYGDIVLGNIEQASLEEIWFSDRFRSIRKKLNQSRVGLELCEKCSHDGSSSSVFYPHALRS
ncbi:MAG TPA: hypothetical protein DCY88_07740 [Cyanobacteria bacterium UBA11372]|nr:hypothetical protein [Cyanobacteria bacterium UBA11372]